MSSPLENVGKVIDNINQFKLAKLGGENGYFAPKSLVLSCMKELDELLVTPQFTEVDKALEMRAELEKVLSENNKMEKVLSETRNELLKARNEKNVAESEFESQVNKLKSQVGSAKKENAELGKEIQKLNSDLSDSKNKLAAASMSADIDSIKAIQIAQNEINSAKKQLSDKRDELQKVVSDKNKIISDLAMKRNDAVKALEKVQQQFNDLKASKDSAIGKAWGALHLPPSLPELKGPIINLLGPKAIEAYNAFRSSNRLNVKDRLHKLIKISSVASSPLIRAFKKFFVTCLDIVSKVKNSMWTHFLPMLDRFGKELATGTFSSVQSYRDELKAIRHKLDLLGKVDMRSTRRKGVDKGKSPQSSNSWSFKLFAANLISKAHRSLSKFGLTARKVSYAIYNGFRRFMFSWSIFTRTREHPYTKQHAEGIISDYLEEIEVQDSSSSSDEDAPLFDAEAQVSGYESPGLANR